MNENTERELKLMLTHSEYDLLRDKIHYDQQRIQINTYYDTADKALSSKLCVLRIRTIGNENILTIKKPQDEISKYEFEREIHTSDMQKLNQEEKEWILQHGIDPETLHPVVRFETDRRILITPDAEISLDKITFAHSVDYELEYEYRSDHDGISEFQKFLKPYGLRYTKNGPGKFARAIADQDKENL